MTRCAHAIAVGLALGLALACGSELFACGDDGDCSVDGMPGACQPEGVCSFPASDCPSGQRYGEHSGGVSGMCVPDHGTTGGVDEAGSGGIDPDEGPDASTLGSLTAVDDDSSSAAPAESSDEAATNPVGTSDDGMSEGSTGVTEIDPDLLLWLRLDDALDDGLANDGVLGGSAECAGETCPQASEGMLGSAAQFDGVDDCAVYPWVSDLDNPAFTVALWYAHDFADLGHAALFDKPVGDANYNTWEVYLLDGADARLLHFTVGAPTGGVATITTAAFTDGWMHLAMTFDGSVLRAFVDGAPIMELAATADIVDEPEGVFIGCDDNHGGTPTGYLSGGLDELRLYARVLSDDEIAALAAR